MPRAKKWAGARQKFQDGSMQWLTTEILAERWVAEKWKTGANRKEGQKLFWQKNKFQGLVFFRSLSSCCHPSFSHLSANHLSASPLSGPFPHLFATHFFAINSLLPHLSANHFSASSHLFVTHLSAHPRSEQRSVGTQCT